MFHSLYFWSYFLLASFFFWKSACGIQNGCLWLLNGFAMILPRSIIILFMISNVLAILFLPILVLTLLSNLIFFMMSYIMFVFFPFFQVQLSVGKNCYFFCLPSILGVFLVYGWCVILLPEWVIELSNSVPLAKTYIHVYIHFYLRHSQKDKRHANG